MIYIFSDSHNIMFVHPDGPFQIKSGGSFTAYSIPDRGGLVPLLDEIKGEKIWFGYGEIDCRFQIFFRSVKNGTTPDIEIDKVTERYTQYIKKLNNEGHNISIVSVVPTQTMAYSGADPVSNEVGNGGKNIERRYVTEVFNSKLKHKCRNMGINYVDIYHYLVDPISGYNHPNMTFDDMHYSYIGGILAESGLI